MKAEGFFGIGITILLLVAVMLYVQSYADAIQNSTTVDNSTKTFVSFTPVLLAMGIFILAGLGIVMVALEMKNK